jgi:hypothetical protein
MPICITCKKWKVYSRHSILCLGCMAELYLAFQAHNTNREGLSSDNPYAD